MPKEYDVQCSECNNSFKLHYSPILGNIIYCPVCNIKNKDICKSNYIIALVAYLSEKLKLGKRDKLYLVRSKPDRCDIILTKKSSEPEIICKTYWTPKDPQRLMDPKRMGPAAIVKIVTPDKTFRPIIQDFIKKEGTDASVPEYPIK